MIFLNLKVFLHDLNLISELVHLRVLCRTLFPIILEVPLDLVSVECLLLAVLVVKFLANGGTLRVMVRVI